MKLLSSWKTGRAAVALKGGSLSSFIYILLSSYFSPRSFRALSRSPRHLVHSSAHNLVNLVNFVNRAAVSRCSPLSSAIRTFRSKLFDVLFTRIPPRALVVWDASRGFICGRQRSQREADNYNISPTAGR